MTMDFDLIAIQEVRNFLNRAKEAQAQLQTFSQEQIDAIVSAMARAGEDAAERLAVMAVEETGFGNAADKRRKNLFAARDVYASIREQKTVGILRRDEQNQVWEVAQPVGIVAGIVPSTNPTSTVIFKSLIAVKAGNAIIFSPHPSAAKCTLEAAREMAEAAVRAGAPDGLIHCLSNPTVQAANELMRHRMTNVILATGGTAMVRAAYSSGKPAFGVGPGNVPVYIHHTADLAEAARKIVQSKTFDYGTICASEQALVVDKAVKPALIDHLKREGAYFLNAEETEKLASLILTNGSLNPRIVGRPTQTIATMAGFSIPNGTRVLVAEESGVGKAYPLSLEKLSPILALYTVQDWQEAAVLCRSLLEKGGLGHTFGIHTGDEEVVMRFGLSQPASRIVVNGGTTFGGIGATTGIQPSLTLGCGSFGNNITSDNIGPQHLFNIKRVAFAIREMAATKNGNTAATHGRGAQAEEGQSARVQAGAVTAAGAGLSLNREEIKDLIKSVLAEWHA